MKRTLSRLRSLHGSLLFRLSLAVVMLIGLMTAVLFLSIDHFVSLQLREAYAERVLRQNADVRRQVGLELEQLEGLLQLAAKDSDLNNSAFYHIRLAGEDKALQEDMQRLGAVLPEGTVSLWEPGGALLIRRDRGDAQQSIDPPLLARWVRHADDAFLAWAGNRPWMVAKTPLMRDTEPLATLVLAAPLSPLLEHLAKMEGAAQWRLGAPGHAEPGVLSLGILDPEGQMASLELIVPNTAAEAVEHTKRLLAGLLVVTAVLSAALITLYLKRQLGPLHELTRLARAVGRGDFGRRAVPRGSGEIARLVAAFNDMAAGVERLCALEQQVRHQEQLSAIGKLATRVAHDINNPLTVVNNVARLMLKGMPVGDSRREDLELIIHHCSRGISIVENLLRFGRPLRLRPKELELGEFCRRVLERCRFRLPHANFVLKPGTPCARLVADPHQLEQLLDNLLNNAVEACNGQPILVEYGEEGGWAYLAVTDNGVGFSREAIEHLFEPFFTTKPGGTGLGLSSCLAIARAHGGRIEIPAPERGQVRVWLPTRPVLQMHALSGSARAAAG